MKISRDYLSKLESTEKLDSNLGNLCVKKGRSFQKERFSFLFQSLMGGKGGAVYWCRLGGLQKKFAHPIVVALDFEF